MKILYISNDPGIPLNGRKGCSTHVRETCHSLSLAGHEVLVSIPVIGEDKFDRHINYKCVIPPVFKSKKIGFDLRLYFSNYIQSFFYNSLIRKYKPDAIYERYSLYSYIGGKISAKYKIPRIVEINAPLATQHSDRLRFPKFAQYIEKKILKQADAVIAISEPLKQYLIGLGINENRITIMPIAVDPALFSADTYKDNIKTKYNLFNKTIFGYVGAFNYYHGIDNVYTIASHLKKCKYNAVLLIVGGEEYKVVKHRKKIQELQLDDYIILTGSVSYDSLPEHIAAMDVAMIFAHTPYASPTKLFEYAAMEKPIIAPDFKPIRAVLDQGEDSKYFIFNPEDINDLLNKIDFLYNNPCIRQKLVKKVKEVILKEHTWESNTEKVIEIYNSLNSKNK